jgi:hypothetical protein
MSIHLVALLIVFLSLSKKYRKKIKHLKKSSIEILVIEKSMAIEKGGDQNFGNKRICGN